MSPPKSAPADSPQPPAGTPHKVIYEQPLNERMRNFLRVDFLYRQTCHHQAGDTVWDSRAAAAALLDLLGIVLRSDLRSEVLKELDRHIQVLTRYQAQPGVDATQLNELLDEIDGLIDRLQQLGRQPGLNLRDNELLASIAQRSGIPGGTCDFDLPIFHFWLAQTPEQRSRDLGVWLEEFDPMVQAIRLLLRLTRTATTFRPELAPQGLFHASLASDQSCQMIRVALPADSPYLAEISGGRHRYSVRFYTCGDLRERPRQSEGDVPFEIACCMI